MERERKNAGCRLPTICALGLLVSFAARADDRGGMTARFSPEEVSPGDLFMLSVEMHRDDYGQFVLEVPSHLRLHLVSRERIPPQLRNGRYHQEERLMLQALSSGPLILSGVRAELTESEGTRPVEFPDLTLDVLPFTTADEIETPQLFPEPDNVKGSGSGLVFLVTGLLIGIGLLAFFIRRKQSPPADSPPKTNPPDQLLTRNFESLLEKHRDVVSLELQADLESFLYAPKRSGIDPAQLKTRLRKELGG